MDSIKKYILERLSEPSSWAGIGLIFNGAILLLQSKGGDTSGWSNIAAGFGALFLPEKTV